MIDPNDFDYRAFVDDDTETQGEKLINVLDLEDSDEYERLFD